jgi:preprotein translocase subunit SecE
MADSEKQGSKIGSWFSESFKGLKAEFRKIVWPTREELLKQTIAVVVVSVVLGLVIAALDWAFQLGFGAIIK